VDQKLFFGEILPNRRFEAVLFAWVNSTEPDNYDMWHSRRIPTKENRMVGRNYAGWRSPELDSALENTRGIGANEVRRAALQREQELLLSEVPIIPLYYRADVSAAKRTVVNFKPNIFAGNFWNAWEWGMR
jgi:peptide/nickel transport system substrate-binding protein